MPEFHSPKHLAGSKRYKQQYTLEIKSMYKTVQTHTISSHRTKVSQEMSCRKKFKDKEKTSHPKPSSGLVYFRITLCSKRKLYTVWVALQI